MFHSIIALDLCVRLLRSMEPRERQAPRWRSPVRGINLIIGHRSSVALLCEYDSGSDARNFLPPHSAENTAPLVMTQAARYYSLDLL